MRQAIHLQCPLSDALTSFFSAPPQPRDEILVPGDPPLTRSMTTRVVAWIEWILDVRLPLEVRRMVEAGCISDWREGRQGEIAGHLQVLQFQEALEPQNQETRDAIREEHQPAIVAALRAQAQDPTAAALITLYDQANAPIAPGSPPLTREMASCYLDLIGFLASLHSTEEWQPLPEPHRSYHVQVLAAQYAALPPAQHAWFGELPRSWTSLRAAWRNAPPESRAQLRNQILMMVHGGGAAPPPFAGPAPFPAPPSLAAFGAPPPFAGPPPFVPGPHDPPGMAAPPAQPAAAPEKTTDDLLQDISRMQSDEERKLSDEAAALEASGDAEAARAARAELTMRKLQNSAQNARMLSNIMSMRHEMSMTFARNIR